MASGSVVRGKALGISVGAIVAATTVLYVSIISSQGEVQIGTVALVVLLLVAALACVIATVSLDDVASRGIAGYAAAGILLSMGVVGLFSIGLPLLVAGILMVAWLARTSPDRRGAGTLAPIAAFVVGAVLPWTLLLLH